MNRRGFLGSILAAAAAPAIVRADSLMRIVPRDLSILTTRIRTAPPVPGAFENPTFTGTVVVNSAYWSLDGQNWHAAEGQEIILPANALGPTGKIYLRSVVTSAPPNAKVARIKFAA